MSNNLIPAKRREKILEMLDSDGSVRVDDLSQLFLVSDMTIRRDLDILEKKGRLERTHGGAIKIHYVMGESLYSEKNQANRSSKEAIGRVTAKLIEDGETVFINGGSTTLQVILHLAHRKDVHVVTNNIAAALSLPEDSTLDLILLGGQFRRQSGCTVGDFAFRVLDEIMPAKAVIGADGISLKSGITSPNPQEAALTRWMMERTRGQIILVADYKKIARVTSFFTASLDLVDILVTDRMPDNNVCPDFEEAGINIIPALSNNI